MPPDGQVDGQGQRVAAAAAIKAARALLQHGFDDARADGANLVLRQGRTTWRIINRVRHEPGMGERVREQFAAMVVGNLVNGPPARERQA